MAGTFEMRCRRWSGYALCGLAFALAFAVQIDRGGGGGAGWRIAAFGRARAQIAVTKAGSAASISRPRAT